MSASAADSVQMQYRRLGRTGLTVSEISLGTVELGTEYGIPEAARVLRPPLAEAARVLNGALDMGVNYIDTARGYGDSEGIIGDCLHTRRNEFVLASKVSASASEGLSPAELRKRVVQSVHESLRALRCEHIDILMVHSASLEVVLRGEVLSILQQLRQQGLISFIGASVYDEAAALAAIRSGDYDCLQIALSMLDRRPERAILPAAGVYDVGIIARSVLLKGALTFRYRHLPDTLRDLRSAIERLMMTSGIDARDLPEMAYRYVLGHRAVHTALVGASSLSELQAAAAFTRKPPLPDSVTRRIRAITVDTDDLLNPAKWSPPGS